MTVTLHSFLCLGALLLRRRIAKENRPEKHQAGIGECSRANKINRICKISAKTGDRHQAWIIKFGEHHDGLAKGRPKTEVHIVVPVEQKEATDSIGEGEEKSSGEKTQTLLNGRGVRPGMELVAH